MFFGVIEIVDIADVAEGSSILPGKGVFTKKPDEGNATGAKGGFRRKTRAVVCGNFEQDLKMEVYASGCDGIALRVLLRLAALRSWSIITVDVKNAFLNATLDEIRAEPTFMRPPYILQKLILVQKTEIWKIKKALCGLNKNRLLQGSTKNC